MVTTTVGADVAAAVPHILVDRAKPGPRRARILAAALFFAAATVVYTFRWRSTRPRSCWRAMATTPARPL